MGGSEGAPQSIYWGGHWREVEHVGNRWRTTSSWWISEAYAAREYFKVVTADGLLCTVYRDMTNDAWYMDRTYD